MTFNNSVWWTLILNNNCIISNEGKKKIEKFDYAKSNNSTVTGESRGESLRDYLHVKMHPSTNGTKKNSPGHLFSSIFVVFVFLDKSHIYVIKIGKLN